MQSRAQRNLIGNQFTGGLYSENTSTISPNPIAMMEDEHDTEGERFRRISALTDGYTCPPDGCQTYKVAFAMLKEFEADLHTHIHLENNILFPKAQELYKQLNS